jgi:hypothetical protein
VGSGLYADAWHPRAKSFVLRAERGALQPAIRYRTLKMKNLLLAVLAFGLFSSSAFAEEGLEKKQFTRVVASRTNQRIGFYTALHPDCTAQQGNFTVRCKINHLYQAAEWLTL